MSRVAVKLFSTKEQEFAAQSTAGSKLRKHQQAYASHLKISRLRTIKMYRHSVGASEKSRVLSSAILLLTCAIKY